MCQVSYSSAATSLGNDLDPMLRRLKSSVLAEVDVHCSFPSQSHEDPHSSLLKLKIVLLRKINKILEESRDSDSTPAQQQELAKLNSTVGDIDRRLNHAASDSASSGQKSLTISPIRTPALISQSPLFAGNQTLHFDLGESHTSLDLVLPKEPPKEGTSKFDIMPLGQSAENTSSELSKPDIKISGPESAVDTTAGKPEEKEPISIHPISKSSSDETPSSPKASVIVAKKAATPKKVTTPSSDVNSCRARKTRKALGGVIKDLSRSRSSQPVLKSSAASKLARPVKKIKLRGQENVSSVSNTTADVRTPNAKVPEVKCGVVLEPQLKVAANERLRAKLGAVGKKTPLGQINSMLNKIKLGEL